VRDPALAKSWAEEYPNSTVPGGESLQQFESRVRREMAFLLGEVTKSPVAVATHAGFIRAVLTKLCGVSEQEAWNRTKDYGSIVALDSDLIRTGEEPA
jgi:alpha-ribazole phosphatase/probable phosphoglycerate mutase